MPSWAILVSAVLILSCGQNHRINDRQTDGQTDRITEADQVGVSNNSLRPINRHSTSIVRYENLVVVLVV